MALKWKAALKSRQ